MFNRALIEALRRLSALNATTTHVICTTGSPKEEVLSTCTVVVRAFPIQAI